MPFEIDLNGAMEQTMQIPEDRAFQAEGETHAKALRWLGVVKEQ